VAIVPGHDAARHEEVPGFLCGGDPVGVVVDEDEIEPGTFSNATLPTRVCAFRVKW